MVSPIDFREARERSRRLADRTSLGVGGTPEFAFEPSSVEEASDVLGTCRSAGIQVRLLGGGTNLLVHDGPLPGAVLSTRALCDVDVRTHTVTVGAGRSFAGLVRRAAAWRIPVLSGCAGIPGTVGGAVAMNAGGRWGTVAEALVAVRGMDACGRPCFWRVRPCDFGYRESPFDELLVTHAVFRREPDLDPAAEQARWRTALAEKRKTQPLSSRSAGCTFRNPTVEGRRVSAGRLIDEAGLKGRRVGGAYVSRLHANFMLNDGSATAEDFQALIEAVRASVRARAGVELELEVRLWG